jgi:hypothetical protein
MKLVKHCTSLLGVLACLAGFAGRSAPAADDGLNWLGDYKEALRQAKETGKPIFLEFRCEA